MALSPAGPPRIVARLLIPAALTSAALACAALISAVTSARPPAQAGPAQAGPAQATAAQPGSAQARPASARAALTRAAPTRAALTRAALTRAALTRAAPARAALTRAVLTSAGAQPAGHAYRRGLAWALASPAGPHAGAAQTSSGARAVVAPVLRYGGGSDGIGVTTGHPAVYLVFWGSQWGTASAVKGGVVTLAGDPSGIAPYLQKLFRGLGTGRERWSGVATQFCQGLLAGATSCPARNRQHVGYPAGGALAGVWADGAAQAPARASGHQIAAEAVRAAAHFGNASASKNRNAQYLIVSPSGTHPDGFNSPSGNFCGWHDWSGDKALPGGPVSSPYGPIAFTNLPYLTDAGPQCGQDFVNKGAAGRLDGVSLVAGHEYAETLTDQDPPGGWADSAGDETADLCQWNAGPGARSADLKLPTGTFAMQPLFIPAPGGGTCEFTHTIVTGGGKARHRLRVTSPGRQRTVLGAPVRLRIRVRDSARGAALRYGAHDLPAGLRIARRSGLITGRPTRAGTFSVRIRVTDGSGGAGSARFTWAVTPSAAVLASLFGSRPYPGPWVVWPGAQAADHPAANDAAANNHGVAGHRP